VDEAERELERLCGLANDVGLFAEEVDPDSHAALGNFPQAFTHVGIVHAALAIAAGRGARPAAEGPGLPPPGRVSRGPDAEDLQIGGRTEERP
jgi:hypothetical protein